MITYGQRDGRLAITHPSLARCSPNIARGQLQFIRSSPEVARTLSESCLKSPIFSLMSSILAVTHPNFTQGHPRLA
jgi:hypothetical protein